MPHLLVVVLIMSEQHSCFQFKASAFTMTVLQLFHSDLDCLKKNLVKKIEMAPQFFNGTPVVIDLHELNTSEASLDFVALKEIIRSFKMIPVGVKGAAPEQVEEIESAGLAVLAESKSVNMMSQSKAEVRMPEPDTTDVEAEEELVATQPVEAVSSETMVVKQNVRSGQQIYAKNGDLVIIGSVGAGAEVLAEGNIHIYGALRGRALAGGKDNLQANIFCQNLDAELISIAGIYLSRDDIDKASARQANHISLIDEKLVFTLLS